MMPCERLWKRIRMSMLQPRYHVQKKELEVKDSTSKRPWVLRMTMRHMPSFEWVSRAHTYLQAHDCSALYGICPLKQDWTVLLCGTTNRKTLSLRLLERYVSPIKTHFFSKDYSRYVSITLTSSGSHRVGPSKNSSRLISRTNVLMHVKTWISWR